jgi:hypothetical protein
MRLYQPGRREPFRGCDYITGCSMSATMRKNAVYMVRYIPPRGIYAILRAFIGDFSHVCFRMNIISSERSDSGKTQNALFVHNSFFKKNHAK